MRRAIAVHTRGHWPEEAAVDSVTLAMIDRHRRRIRLVADSGAPFLLDLARAQHLADGDGLELDNGNYLRVRAAPEPVIDIAADSQSESHHAARADDEAGVYIANRRGLAFRATAELALEAAQQGEAFLNTCRAAWPEASPHPNPPPLAGEGVLADTAAKTLPRKRGREARRGSGGRVGAATGEGVCHSAAFGVAAARAGIVLEDGLLG